LGHTFHFGVRLVIDPLQNLCRPQLCSLPRFLDAADWLGRVNVVSLGTELITSGSIALGREDVMLGFALWEGSRAEPARADGLRSVWLILTARRISAFVRGGMVASRSIALRLVLGRRFRPFCGRHGAICSPFHHKLQQQPAGLPRSEDSA
jgi:hypothetical protein